MRAGKVRPQRSRPGVSWRTVADDDAHGRHTRHFAPDAMVGWPFAIAALERLRPWAVFALRIGILALLQETVRAMASRRAKRELVAKLKEFVEALERLPWD